jgi:hypothetical protein
MAKSSMNTLDISIHLRGKGMISCLVGVGHVYQILNEKWNYAFLLYMRNGFNAKISLVERLVKSMYNHPTS